jgi:hypothetical protein
MSVANEKRAADPIALALAEPFDLAEIQFKPKKVSGNRALAIAFVDARAIQDRLDEVLGVAGWEDYYDCLPDGSVVCRLRLRIGDEWITKVDVGSPSEQSEGGDRLKAAFSDALKRVAVKFGIGRYLYRLSGQWVDYDPKRKQLAGKPQLPPWALLEKDRPRAAQRNGTTQHGNGSPAKPQAPPVNRSPVNPHALPADGVELSRRLADYDARLAEQGFCMRGDLVRHVVQTVSKAGPKPGYGSDLQKWPQSAIFLAFEETKAFEQSARSKENTRRATEQRLTAGQKPAPTGHYTREKDRPPVQRAANCVAPPKPEEDPIPF